MGSVVHSRLEPSPLGPDLRPGLQARIHDPLWLLARQWQFGEFAASDTGSPVQTVLAVRTTPLTTWTPQGGKAQPYPGDAPLESLVEATGVGPTWADRRRAGLRLARVLRRAGIDPAPLVGAYPLTAPDPAVDPDADPDSHATSSVTPTEVATTAAVVAGRVCDPTALAAAGLAAALALAGEPAKPVLSAFLDGWATTTTAPPSSWDAAALEYGFTAAVGDPTAPDFTAQRFAGGALDWFDVDAASPSAGTQAAAVAVSRAIPTAVTFRGAPVGRYWHVEDSRLDYGGVDAYPTEIGKLLLSEFTACFAGTWYRIPVRVPYGSAVQVSGLATVDTFGVATVVPAAGTGEPARLWKMFEHTGDTAAAPWLLVPPVLADSFDGPVQEEVAFSRDPAADLCWAVERVVTNAVGRPVQRLDDLSAQGRTPPPDPRDPLPDTWVWRLETSVPENWIPFVPTRGRSADDDYSLVQGAVLRYRRAADGTVSAVPVLPASEVLRGQGLVLPEREVPREGVTVRRAPRLARWVDGSRVSWSSWRVAVGQGESSSGLAYDGLHPEGQAASLGQ